MTRLSPSTRISFACRAFFARSFSCIVRSSDALTSSGVIAVPSWNFTFGRMWKRHVVASMCSHLSASCGTNSMCSSTATSVSPAPMRVSVQPSQACAGSSVSPNHQRARLRCPALLFMPPPPQPVKARREQMRKSAIEMRFMINLLEKIAETPNRRRFPGFGCCASIVRQGRTGMSESECKPPLRSAAMLPVILQNPCDL